MMLLLGLYLAFARIGALAFGGAYAAIPLVEQEVVAKAGWMTYAEFMDLLALDEVTPGPILINSATFVGMRVAGVPGAVAATLGCITIPCLVALCLLHAFRRWNGSPVTKGVVHALKCMALALVASSTLTLVLRTVVPTVLGGEAFQVVVRSGLVLASFIVLHRQKTGPIPVLLACGVANLMLGLALWRL